MIDAGQTGVVVPYGESKELVAAFQKTTKSAEKIRFLKRLQKYTVNVFPHTLSKLVNAGALYAVEDTFYMIDSSWYDSNEQGLLTEPQIQPLIM